MNCYISFLKDMQTLNGATYVCELCRSRQTEQALDRAVRIDMDNPLSTAVIVVCTSYSAQAI